MTPEDKERALSDIRENIAQYGYHLYIVSGATTPRFAYAIGLSPKIGKELIFAGAIFYMYKEIAQIIKRMALRLIADPASEQSVHHHDLYGDFALRGADPSWATAMMLGALDFYQKPEVPALQILPDKVHWTVDVPDMATPWSQETSSGWKGLKGFWPYPIPRSSHARTDLDSLQGAPVTEACRWEEDYWELFAGAGPDVSDEQTRVVPLGALLDADSSLVSILELPVGAGIWRNETMGWQTWTSSQGTADPSQSS